MIIFQIIVIYFYENNIMYIPSNCCCSGEKYFITLKRNKKIFKIMYTGKELLDLMACQTLLIYLFIYYKRLDSRTVKLTYKKKS